MDRRNPYRPFESSLISKFLRGRKIVIAELMPAGKSNTNYKLILDDNKAYLLRLYSHGGADYENYAMNLVKDLVPVPLELERGEGWSVFPFLPGQLLVDVPAFVVVAAEALAKISSVVFDAPGMIGTRGEIRPFPWHGMTGFVTFSLENPEVQMMLGQRLMDNLMEILLKEASRLAELDAQSHLVHGDFNPTNILIHQGAISGVLDWEFCHSGSPYMDIGNLLRHTHSDYFPAVRRGLESGRMRLPDDWVMRAKLIDLTNYLEFLTSNRSETFKRECVTRIEEFATHHTTAS